MKRDNDPLARDLEDLIRGRVSSVAGANKLSNREALNVVIDSRLAKSAYTAIRKVTHEKGNDIYPSWYKVSHFRCYVRLLIFLSRIVIMKKSAQNFMKSVIRSCVMT